VTREIRGSNYVQLATVTESGEPRVRTVVMRGMLLESFKFITDSRSDKVLQLTCQPIAEMCWWFSASSEQYRFRGKIVIVDDAELRRSQWNVLSSAAKDSFLTPGSLLESNEVPKTFLMLLLEPEFVDYLRLTDNKHLQWEKNNCNWVKTEIDPSLTKMVNSRH